MSDITRILSQIEQGDTSAADELLPLVYDELRRLAAARMAQEKAGQTIQATALVHEAYLRLVGQDSPQEFDTRGHFFAAAAEAMRRILVERARHKETLKAGGKFNRVEFPEQIPVVSAGESSQVNLVLLDAALTKLEQRHPRRAEIVKLRFFAGLTASQAASTLGIARSTADADWAYAKAWLQVEMESEGKA